jgi:hypothetical protein
MVTALYPASEGDILSQDFFVLGYSIVYTNGSGTAGFTFEDAIARLGPNFITGLNSLGKSTYSTILSDLGQSVESNPFAHLPLLMKFMIETQFVSVDRFFALKTFD